MEFFKLSSVDPLYLLQSSLKLTQKVFHISTNNIARGMVRGSQVRFQSTKIRFCLILFPILPSHQTP
jgi:hypothetical protein